jgi:hypothetical protein
MSRLSEGVGELLGGGKETTWRGDVEELLYDGEAVDRTVAVGTGEVVVTSHRVLVFTPERDGKRFRQVDRPNVVGVGLDHDGNERLLVGGLKWGVISVLLAGAGQVFSLDSLVSDISFGGGGVGLGGVMGLLQQMLSLMAMLDELLTIVGALGVILAVGVLAVYMHTRERVLRLELAGEEDVIAPVADDVDEGVVAQLESALTASSGVTPPDGTSPTSAPPDGSLKSDDPLGSPDGTDGGS